MDSDLLTYIMAIGNRETATNMSITCIRLYLYFGSQYKHDRTRILREDVGTRMRNFMSSDRGPPINLKEYFQETGGLIRGNTISRVIRDEDYHYMRESKISGGIECLIFLPTLGERESTLKRVVAELKEKLNAASPSTEWFELSSRSADDDTAETLQISLKCDDCKRSDIHIQGTERSIAGYLEMEARNSWDTVFFDGDSLAVYEPEQFNKLIDRKSVTLQKGLLTSRYLPSDVRRLMKFKQEGYSISADSLIPPDELDILKTMLIAVSEEVRGFQNRESVEDLIEDVKKVGSRK